MAAPAGFCPRCGSPLQLGSAFCPRCGSPVALQPATAQRPPARRKGLPTWAIVLIVVAVVIVVLVLIAAAFYGLAAASGVQVSAVNWSGSNTCGGLSGSTTPGFTGGEATTESLTIAALTNLDPILSCTINSVSAGTPEFLVVGGNFPLTIAPGGEASLNVQLLLPAAHYNGVLSLTVN